MLKQILSAALIAGLLGGVAVSLLQMAMVTPLIHEAELYESGQNSPAIAVGEQTDLQTNATEHNATEHNATEHNATEHDEDSWVPDDGLERSLFTLLANILTATGFSLLLCAGYALYGSAGTRQISAKRGVLWGLAGFVAFGLAPGLGLPPEVPGSVAAPLFDRQIWWLATVVATICGISLAVFNKKFPFRFLGGALILVPHLVGAPHPQSYGGTAPPELAAHFVVASLVTGAIFWAFLGGISGFLFQKMKEKQ